MSESQERVGNFLCDGRNFLTLLQGSLAEVILRNHGFAAPAAP